jgi:hypothetical protein
MENKIKNVKIGNQQHEMLKKYCKKNGLKIYVLLEKIIEDFLRPKKKDIYGEET